MTKRAFLVLGPESSGTRLMTCLLISAGCYGDDGHEQRLDHGLPVAEPLIVWRRSLPHRGEWPDLRAIIRNLKGAGYETTALVMSRDWHALVQSQLAAPHALDTETALAQIRQAYALIFYMLHVTDTPSEIVNLEALIQRPNEVAGHLMQRLGLPQPTGVEIYDANAKYYSALPLVRDAETVRRVMMEKYGFEPTSEFIADFVSFVEAMTDES